MKIKKKKKKLCFGGGGVGGVGRGARVSDFFTKDLNEKKYVLFVVFLSFFSVGEGECV